MPAFLDTDAAVSRIIAAAKNADQSLILITPYVQLWPKVTRWLRDADKRGVSIDVVCRASDLNDEQRRTLASFTNLTLRDAPDLHAKCYANESGVVLTSFNLYQASRKNYEMGVCFDAEEDAELYGEAMQEARHIVEGASEVAPAKSRKRKRAWLTRGKTKPPHGHCIRCKASIGRDAKKPYCASCFRKWARYKNPTYADDYCHGCGREDEGGFSLERPECYTCFKVQRRRKRAAA